MWSSELKRFVSVKHHPNAQPSSLVVKTVWTLITSSREIPVRGLTKAIRFADWEEIPDTPFHSEAWDKIVRKIINPRDFLGPYPVPEHPPCLDPEIRVKKSQGGFVPLRTVQRGDWILSNTGWTKVVGICHREVDGGMGLKGNRITDGLWILEGMWKHPTGAIDSKKWRGIQLVTEAGCFYILRPCSNKAELVRDFTEVGIKDLLESYAREDEIVPDKKKIVLDKKSK
jgi:hypothetical protein